MMEDIKPTENFDELKKVYEKIDLPFQDKDTRKRQITEKIMAAKPTIRRITCNKDLIVLLICCLSCILFGYALNTFIAGFTDNSRSINQVTTQVNQVNQVSTQVTTQSNFKELILLFFISFFSAISKLVVNKGFISEKFSEKLADVVTKIGELWKEFFKKNENIDPETYITIVGDRKER